LSASVLPALSGQDFGESPVGVELGLMSMVPATRNCAAGKGLPTIGGLGMA